MPAAAASKKGSQSRPRLRLSFLFSCCSTLSHTGSDGGSLNSAILSCIFFSNSWSGIRFYFMVNVIFFNPADQQGPCPCVLGAGSTFVNAKHFTYFNMCVSFYGVQVKYGLK